ncbi:MAG TPA: hypothetical protein VGK00_03215 [Anaerolineales bacterium]|jgi:hypothetical protein
MIDFVRLVETDLHQSARKVGGSLFFKCPFHGGGKEKHGSLKVSNGDESHGPGFYCFGCNEHGGPVGYFLKRGYTLEEARRMAGAESQPGHSPQPAESFDPPDNPPNPTWQGRARDFMKYTQNQFLVFGQSRGSETDFDITDPETGAKKTERMYPVEWWLRRGLTVPTGSNWGIGYNPKEIKNKIRKEEFGLPADSENPYIWIPQGFVIPCVVGPDVWYIKIRRTKGEPKYIHIPGSIPALYMAENVTEHETVIFTEGELDALLAWQEIDALAGIATLGAATNARRLNIATWGLYLLYPKYKFAAYDLDEAGKKGAADLARFNFRRLEIPQMKPFDKDLTDYYARTGQLKEWFVSELEKYPGALPESIR